MNILIKRVETLSELIACRRLASKEEWLALDTVEFATREFPATFIALNENNDAVGYACCEVYTNVSDTLHKEENTFGCLNDILVDSALQGQGIAKHLLNAVYTYLLQNNVRYIRLHAEQSDTYLINFYEKRGYKTLCLLHSYYAETGEHAYYMEKDLNEK